MTLIAVIPLNLLCLILPYPDSPSYPPLPGLSQAGFSFAGQAHGIAAGQARGSPPPASRGEALPCPTLPYPAHGWPALPYPRLAGWRIRWQAAYRVVNCYTGLLVTSLPDHYPSNRYPALLT